MQVCRMSETIGSMLLSLCIVAMYACAASQRTETRGQQGDATIDSSKPQEVRGLRVGDHIAGKGTLVWHDEFDGTELDSAKWNYEIGIGNQYKDIPPGWGNAEKQYYQPENVRVQGGKLIIEAKKQSVGGMNYTSGRITTAGVWSTQNAPLPRKYMTPKSGFVEARLKSPSGAGFWPAFWLLGANANEHNGLERVGWPRCGEIDIFETNGANPTLVDQTIHYGTKYPESYWHTGKKSGVANASEAYHIYGVGWNSTELKYFIDGVMTQTIVFPLPEESAGANSAAFYGGPGFSIIINLALGGFYLSPDAGTVPSDAVLAGDDWERRSIMVDWVRVFQ